MRVQVCLAAAAAVFASLASALPADAGFVASVSGSTNVIAAPATAISPATQSDSYQVWDETSGTLSASLQVDQAGQSGNFDGTSNYAALGTTLPAGTPFESVMVQLNPQTQFPAQSPIGSITFNGRIIGLALFGPSLDASDVYGNPSTTVPHGLPNFALQNRGIDIAHDDRFSISADGLTLSLQLTAGLGSFDEIRVFVSSTSVPEPASLVLWTGICCLIVLRSRGFAKSTAYTCVR